MPNSLETTINIRGLDEIERRLQALPDKIRRKHVRKALQDGSELVRAEAAGLVARRKIAHGWEGFVERPGAHLKDFIVTKVTVTGVNATARVGLDYKKVHHGHLVEFGTRPHKVGKRQHPGARKQPFMRPAFDSKGDAAVETITTQLAQAVEKEV